MRRWWRQWLPGPKHGIARGVAVFGPNVSDADALSEVLRRDDRLQAWAATMGVVLTGEPEDLRRLDEVVTFGAVPPDVLSWLPNAAGLYLGTLLVDTVDGAAWAVWPNGHPVVRLPGGADADVTAIAGRAVTSRSSDLWSAYQRLAT
jgi:Family of unknown function (DUF6278)